jgi:peptide deformylase
MVVRSILIYPNPSLRRKAKRVQGITEEVSALVRDMLETMRAAPGIGLAAPQVGVSLRVIVVDPSTGEDPKAVLALINPEIISTEGSCVAEEGCLSLPEVAEEVERAERVTVQAESLDGRKVEVKAEGLLARILQHEVDHLEGTLLIDHLNGVKRELVEQKLRKRQREAVEAS